MQCDRPTSFLPYSRCFILILAHTEITEITEKRALHGSIGSHRVQMVTENDNPKNLLNLLIIRNAD
jgi:hypothetical protein